MSSCRRIVLLACGAFNPPTHLHLRMFELARDYLHRLGRFHVVAGLISPVHDAYGKKGLASAGDRCEMVQLAVNNSDWIHLSDWECSQSDWTPSRQVLEIHQNLVDSVLLESTAGSVEDPACADLLPDSGRPAPSWTRRLLGKSSAQLRRTAADGPVEVRMLCGADLLESFGRPGLWKPEDMEAIVGTFGLVVITREGSNPLRFIYESDLLTRHQHNIDLVTEWVTNEVSSSRIRRALSRHESVKYLIPDPVIEYVYRHKLYGASPSVRLADGLPTLGFCNGFVDGSQRQEISRPSS